MALGRRFRVLRPASIPAPCVAVRELDANRLMLCLVERASDLGLKLEIGVRAGVCLDRDSGL